MIKARDAIGVEICVAEEFLAYLAELTLDKQILKEALEGNF
jgi:hypothetical protein